MEWSTAFCIVGVVWAIALVFVEVAGDVTGIEFRITVENLGA